MKLQAVWISLDELQDYLDKYQDKVKFMSVITSGGGGMPTVAGKPIILVIDMS